MWTFLKENKWQSLLKLAFIIKYILYLFPFQKCEIRSYVNFLRLKQSEENVLTVPLGHFLVCCCYCLCFFNLQPTSHVCCTLQRGTLNPIAEGVTFTWLVRELPIVRIQKNSRSPKTCLFKVSLDNSMDQPNLFRRFPDLGSVWSSESIIVA